MGVQPLKLLDLPYEVLVHVLDYLPLKIINSLIDVHGYIELVIRQWIKSRNAIASFSAYKSSLEQPFSIVTGKCQSGKTKTLLSVFDHYASRNPDYRIIILLQNKRDHESQFLSRIGGRDITSVASLPVPASRSQGLVIIHNKFRLEKLEKILTSSRKRIYSKYLLIIDEYDAILGPSKAGASAIASAKFDKYFPKPVSFLGISATPRQKDSNLIVSKIPVPLDYCQITECIPWEASDSGDPGDLQVLQEAKRIVKTNSPEFILYSTIPKIARHKIVAARLFKKGLDVVIYNGHGLRLYTNSLPNTGRMYKGKLSDLLGYYAHMGRCLVVVGRNLISRGISFTDGNLVASVLFCESIPSAKASIIQKISRVCGTARPDVPRRVVYTCSKRKVFL